MQKQNYISPDLIVFGTVETITKVPNPRGNAYGHSCGNGNVSGPSDCGKNIQTHDDKGLGIFKNDH
ncbi:MAG: hypothetical protein IT319_06420 [Anaerolineae bacterium]|nr:hypothetical protein [Anaerolineae bacterium]